MKLKERKKRENESWERKDENIEKKWKWRKQIKNEIRKNVINWRMKIKNVKLGKKKVDIKIKGERSKLFKRKNKILKENIE